MWFPPAREISMLVSRQRKHFVKCVGQRFHKRAADFQTEIAPTGRHPVTFVFFRDVESTNKCRFLITDQNLPMIAQAEMMKGQPIEPAKLSSARFKSRPKVIGKRNRTASV